METCLYCHGTNIKACVEVGQNADGGATGLKFRHRFLFIGVEPVLADLCLDCGSIVRLSVGNPGRNWRVKSR